ncbi:hypothetical protein LTR62_006159 [Meristemomyces frigidus]|uniref:Multicopper oxidase n=1 Tax=Meristemomyces frigidus TaxID=1508187 RepID=A0AAN7TCZ0_9PEZI|nr:hypothetical protein LTR62_006159 [Meristemomyces frigidus]
MDPRGRVDDHELSARSSLSLHSNEQEQGLLGAWRREGEEEEEEQDVHDANIRRDFRRSWQQRRWHLGVWAALVGAVALAVLVVAGSIIWLTHASDEVVVDTVGVQTSSYGLSPTWDYRARPRRREYTWTVRDQMHNPDGVYRPMILVNNQFPGPMIEVNSGDTIVVHVDNQAINATSIHWHGIYQNGTPHMDGTVGITQCPIAPGGKFTYEFTVTGQSGTYWWHGHQGVQSSDGMHGPLIIHGRKEKEMQQISYATDRVIMLSDHYHDLSSALLWQYLKPDMENAEPVPESALINGRNVRNCADYPDRECDNSTANVGQAVFDLKRHESHRLRIINVGAFAEFQFQIDEHELAVTEVDGTDVVPVNYHRLNINPAQRYSVIINTTVSTADSFWLRARMITQCFTDAPETMQADVYGIVRYSKTDQLPTSKDWEETLASECRDMDTTELKPVDVIPAPSEANAFFYFRSNFEIGDYRLSRGKFDTSSWRPSAHSPTLHRAIDGLAAGNTSFTASSDRPAAPAFINDLAFSKPTELVLQTTGIQTLDILVSNFDDGNHPLHLHGYKYFVLAQGHGYPPMKSALDGMTRENIQPLYDSLDLRNPLRRDTASVEAFGWILLRLVADNPGVWAFHCHVSWHAEAGLLMQFLTRADELVGMEVPRGMRELCSAGGIEKGMGPQDEEYWDLAK